GRASRSPPRSRGSSPWRSIASRRSRAATRSARSEPRAGPCAPPSSCSRPTPRRRRCFASRRAPRPSRRFATPPERRAPFPGLGIQCGREGLRPARTMDERGTLAGARGLPYLDLPHRRTDMRHAVRGTRTPLLAAAALVASLAFAGCGSGGGGSGGVEVGPTYWAIPLVTDSSRPTLVLLRNLVNSGAVATLQGYLPSGLPYSGPVVVTLDGFDEHSLAIDDA